MIFHCQICSANGERLSDYSAMARIVESKIRLPLRADMFEARDPDRDPYPPWRMGVTWDRMLCPWHRGLPWVLDEKETREAMRVGGPYRILTDEGWFTVNSLKWQYEQQKPVLNIPSQAELEAEWNLLSRVRQESVTSGGSDIAPTSLVDALEKDMRRGMTASQIAQKFGITRQKVIWTLKRTGSLGGK